MRQKRAAILDPGDEVLKRPGEVVTVTEECFRTTAGLLIQTDRGNFLVPRDAEVTVVAEGR
jgi:hypothetical protein